jgi:F0F1-type ATP synthase assembly protein I
MNKKSSKKINTEKEAYLDRIKDETSYPVLRGLISVMSNILIALATVSLVVGLLLSIYFSNNSPLFAVVAFIISILISSLIYIAGRLLYEAASIFADIADSVIDLNYRYDRQ